MTILTIVLFIIFSFINIVRTIFKIISLLLFKTNLMYKVFNSVDFSVVTKL